MDGCVPALGVRVEESADAVESPLPILRLERSQGHALKWKRLRSYVHEIIQGSDGLQWHGDYTTDGCCKSGERHDYEMNEIPMAGGTKTDRLCEIVQDVWLAVAW